MPYCVRAGELLAALYNADMPYEAKQYEAALEAIVNMMADTLSAKFNIKHTRAKYSCGMIAVNFYPSYEGQVVPQCITAFDDEEEWTCAQYPTAI